MDSEVRYGFSVVPEARAPVLPGLGAALLASVPAAWALSPIS